MNANELADVLENDYWDSRANKVMLEGAKMLRQQQTEIEALKQIIDTNNLNQNIGQFVKPANEPVAWMDEINTFVLDKDYQQFPKSLQNGMIPLYTHQYQRPHNSVLVPCDKLAEMQAKLALLKAHPIKELTDEEILEVHIKTPFIDGYLNNNLIEFARAILRKAQEK